MAERIDLDKPEDPELLGAEQLDLLPEDKKESPAKEDLEAVVEAEEKEDVSAKKVADDAASKAAGEQGSLTVPHSRFNEVNEALKEARAALAEKDAEIAASKAAPKPNISELEKEYADLIYGGDTEKAAAVRMQINNEIFWLAKSEAVAESRQEMAVREHNKDYADTYAQAVKDYPFIGYVKNEAGQMVPVNSEAVDDVVALRDLNVAKGMSGPDALLAAAKVMAKVYAPPVADQDPANVVQIDKRKAEAIARNARDSKAQPAALVAGVGARALPSTQMPTSQVEWEKLSDGDREKLLA